MRKLNFNKDWQNLQQPKFQNNNHPKNAETFCTKKMKSSQLLQILVVIDYKNHQR